MKEISNYLKKQQPVPYKIFENAIKRGAFSQAYLLNGYSGIPLKEIALFLAASFYCKNSETLACEECFDCNKILNLDCANENIVQYKDIILLDGPKETIKIDNIRYIEKLFSSTSVYPKFYIINIAENITQEASNCLLKFLEEPPANTYAILTTNNQFKILPTIRSRVQIINFKKNNQFDLVLKCNQLQLNQEDAELLSFFINDTQTIQDISLQENYQEYKNKILTFFENFSANKLFFLYFLQNFVDKIKTKQEARDFFDILLVFFKEAINYKLNRPIILQNYVKILDGLATKLDLENSVIELVDARNELDSNVNISLLLYNKIKIIFGE